MYRSAARTPFAVDMTHEEPSNLSGMPFNFLVPLY
jgi:hypothetical protein